MLYLLLNEILVQKNIFYKKKLKIQKNEEEAFFFLTDTSKLSNKETFVMMKKARNVTYILLLCNFLTNS